MATYKVQFCDSLMGVISEMEVSAPTLREAISVLAMSTEDSRWPDNAEYVSIENAIINGETE